MDDLPYTTPDEDPFNVRPLPRRRRSSLLDKWIHEQQHYSPSPATHTRSASASAASRAYLAYPELTHLSLDPDPRETPNDAGYDLVDDDDIPGNLAADLNTHRVTDVPDTLRTTKRNSRMSLSPTSFRHFNLGFRSTASPPQDNDPATPSRKYNLPRTNRSPTNMGDPATGQPTSQKRSSVRTSRIFGNSFKNPSPTLASKTTPSLPKWRPSVLDHFGQSPRNSSVPAVSQASVQAQTDSIYTPSRPSLSSSINTHTSLTVPSPEGSASHHQHSPVFSERSQGKRSSLQAPTHISRNISPSGASSVSFRSEGRPLSNNSHKPPLYLTNLLSPDTGRASSSPTLSSPITPRGYYPSIRSNGSQYSSRRSANTFDAISPTSFQSHFFATDDAEGVDDSCVVVSAPTTAEEPQQGQSKKKKPSVVYSSASHGRTLSRMASLSNINLPIIPKNKKKKKKKLIVSGVAPNDVQKFEGVKHWCESFGEVRQILRMPNGDLVISFQSAEVADTVCRVRAKVTINGVGSVHLSWTTEKKH